MRELVRRLRWAWDHSVGWLLKWALLLPIKAYQLVVSPMMPPTCRFHPSCSRYAVEAISTHGAGKGLLLGSWRLLRCNPWNLGGLDPVPARGDWRPDILPDGRPRSSEQPPLQPARRFPGR